MTAPTEDIHSCSMYCTRPACVLAQRDEMRAEIARLREQDPVDMSMILGAVARGWCHKGNASKELDVVLAKAIADEIAELFAAATPAQPAPETIADHERAYELLFKENARLRGRFEVAQDRAPLERFNLDCHYDGFDQMREFVLASDHDARVHDLETICDPAGIVTENALLKQTAKELVAMVNRLKRDAAQPAAQPVQRLSDEQRRELIDVLRGGRQCDEDGTEIIMSRQACCEAADIIEAALQPQGWQPIETAPKDGQEFVTANSMQGFVKELVSWNRIHGYWQSKGKSIHMQATHWMPLPARPGDAS